MNITLTICSWLLVALGIATTAWLYPHPLAFLPYLFFSFAIISARRVRTLAIVLVPTLLAVCVAFWFFWDALVHPSTLNLIRLEVVFAETLIAGATWLVVRRIERKSPTELAKQ
jgi:ABC-type Na+ efflux pump permease subunit